MRKGHSIFLLVVILFASAGTHLTAQKISKYYTQRSQDGGFLFFIFPNEDFSSKQTKTGFAFDITYITGYDSAVVNFTFYTKIPTTADSLVIHSANKNISSPVKRLYTDFRKKHWEYRYSANFEIENLTEALTSATPPDFQVFAVGEKITFHSKKGKWRKYTEAMNKIFYIIESNTR
jgi:hypothetical protein